MSNNLNTNNPEEIKKWNEEMIVKYNLEHYFDQPNTIIRWVERRRIQKILKELLVDASSKTLEVGCGAGQILAEIREGTLYGFDLSERMISVTRERLMKIDPKRIGTLVPGDAQAWPKEITEQEYTNIYCSEVIEHIPHPEILIQELHRTATEKTKAIVISTPNEPLIQKFKDILIKIGIFKWIFPHLAEKMTDEWHLSSFDIPLMKKVTNGLFEIEKIQGAPYNWLPIRYIFTLKKIPSSSKNQAS